MRTQHLWFTAVIALRLVAQQTDLPTSKRSGRPVPPKELVNSMPSAVAVSAQGDRLAFVHTGFGANANHGQQSISLVDPTTGSVTEFSESRMKSKAKQTFSFGACFSHDGKHLFVSVGSSTEPLPHGPEQTGDGIAVYKTGAQLAWERFIPLPPVSLGSDKQPALLSQRTSATEQVTFPAGIAAFTHGEREKLVVAEQLSDTVSLVDVASGRVEGRTEVGVSNAVPSAYPYNLIVDQSRAKAYVSLWNASQVVELDLPSLTVTRRFSLSPADATQSSSHPAAMTLDTRKQRLFVALANRDTVATIHLSDGKTEYASTGMRSVKYGGLFPDGLALSQEGRFLFVANASQNSVAVLDVGGPSVRYVGAFPTAWYPTVLATVGDDLYVATAKAQNVGANKPKSDSKEAKDAAYIAHLLRGSISRKSIPTVLRGLTKSTVQVEHENRYLDSLQTLQFASHKNPIKHVIYIIKENRTYDQLFGDINGANGDPSLVMYGEDITPNHHALARQFGVLDNFYDSGEVSGNGHVWSTAAITSDYTERIWPIAYRGNERTYDFEGNVSNGIPLMQGISDVNEPGTGYLWTNLARNHRTYRHYGEFVETTWCSGGAKSAPEAGEDSSTHPCDRSAISKGDILPNGHASPFPWQIPLIFENTATKRELRDHFDPSYADFNLDYPDQLRADEFIRELKQYEIDGRLPEFIVMRLPNDHTSGSKAGKPSPRAAIADNDLALGRVVEAVSHSKYWDDTAIFVLEDDAQNGQDHVDAHRSIALVISKYSPTHNGATFVESGFYTTVNMIHTMEALLGLPPMNANDAYAPIMHRMFSGDGGQKPYVADHRNEKSGMLYELNPGGTPLARQSEHLDFSHADAADSDVLNRILWVMAKGRKKMPAPKHHVISADLTRGRDLD